MRLKKPIDNGRKSMSKLVETLLLGAVKDTDLIDKIMAEIEALVQDAYEDGKSEGDRGYSRGYDEGLRDGLDRE